MVLGKLKDKLLSGYPGGYRHMRRGTQPVGGPPPFQLPAHPLVVAMRRLFVEHARDVKRRREREEELPESPGETEAERMVREVDAQVAEAS